MTQRQDVSGLMAFFFGTIVGAGVALLFAPMSGKDTRRRIAEIDPDSITGPVNDAIDSVSGIVDRGVDAYKKASTQAHG
jgi:gas vesicle protein